MPQYKGLGIREFLEKAKEYPDTDVYLPDARDHDKLPRQWLISLLYTLVGRPFADWAL